MVKVVDHNLAIFFILEDNQCRVAVKKIEIYEESIEKISNGLKTWKLSDVKKAKRSN